MKKLLLVLFLVPIILFFWPRPKPYAVLKAREGAGLFSMMTDVVALLNAYEKKTISGFEIDFGAEGVYYEPSEGPNWWLYFCEPLQKGERKAIVTGSYGKIPGVPPYEFFNTRQDVFRLIQKYIHFRPEILNNIHTFCQTHFDNSFVIGVHYRGTDWSWGNEFPKLPYSLFFEQIERQLLANPAAKIFIATDEQSFLEEAIQRFGHRVCFQKEAYRTQGSQGLHMDKAHNKKRQAQEAMIDCLLLSKTNCLIGTGSNLCRWASFFNPDIPYLRLDLPDLIKPVGSI